ncbi:MAG: patatin-like phospholipase family protein [Candidatus Paceibacterota bacterium]|jgi:NTE family protein
MEQKRKTVGLALGSGSDRGMSHIGVIKTLLKHNIPIDYISGTSIGAVVGAYYALHGEVDGIEKPIKNVMSRPWYLFDFNFQKPNFLSNRNLYNVLSYNFYREKTFADTKIPFRTNATDIDTGNQYVFKDGKIIDAVVASISLPGILPPYEIDGKHLVDGGLSNAIPVDLLAEFKPDIVIAVDLYNTKMVPLPKYDIGSVVGRTYQIYISKLSEFSKKDFCNTCKNFIILNPDTNETIDSVTFKNIEKNIKIGMEETERRIEEIKKMII